jgi:AcrR family transcriptional regulator
MSAGGPAAGRTYGGVGAEERRGARRERLVAAGLELYGRDGYAATTIASVCREAGLNERYFYESFGGREDLLAAVYDHVIARVMDRVLAAVGDAGADPAARARAGLTAFVETLDLDRRLARIQLIEVVGVSPALEQRRREIMHRFAGLIAASAPPAEAGARTESDLALSAMALVGATNELVIDFVQGSLDVSRDRLVAHLASLYLAAAAVSSQD